MKRLLIRPGAIGDTIVSLPALKWLSGGETEIWAPGANLPLLKHLGEVRSLASTGLDLLEIPGQPQTALPLLERFDEIVSWYGAARPAFQEAVSRLPFRFLPALPSQGCDCHAVDFYLRQVGAPEGAVPRLPWEWRPQGYVAIHPFSGSPRKNWPIEKFQEAARRLKLPVEWCAGPEEELPGARRFDDLGQLAEWVSRASYYLGNDSGVTHLAAACGVPVVAIFGPTDPAVWGPRGRSVKVLRWPEVEEAVRACIPRLER